VVYFAIEYFLIVQYVIIFEVNFQNINKLLFNLQYNKVLCVYYFVIKRNIYSIVVLLSRFIILTF